MNFKSISHGKLLILLSTLKEQGMLAESVLKDALEHVMGSLSQLKIKDIETLLIIIQSDDAQNCIDFNKSIIAIDKELCSRDDIDC